MARESSISKFDIALFSTITLLVRLFLLIHTSIMFDKFSLTSFNCRGAMSNCLYIQRLLNVSDILCIQEHHLFVENANFLNTIDNQFMCFTRCQSKVLDNGTKIRQGGVAIMWKNSIDQCVSQICNIHSDRILGVQITQHSKQPVYLFNVYLPSGNHDYASFEQTMLDIIELYECYRSDGTVIFAGDFNCSISVGYRSILSTNADARRVKLFEHFLLSTNQCSLVTHRICTGPRDTYYAYHGGQQSQIDHILMSVCELDLVEKVCVHDNNILNKSDHCPISLSISQRSVVDPVNTRRLYRWDKADTAIYRETLDGCLIQNNLADAQIHSTVDIEHVVNTLQTCIIDVSNLCVPKSQYLSYRKPYWNVTLSQLHNNQKQFRRVWINEGRPRQYTNQAYANYKQAKKLFTKGHKKAITEYNQNKYNDINLSQELDLRKFWKYVRGRKHIGKSDNSTGTFKDDSGVYVDADSQLLMWQNHFKCLLNEGEGENSQYNDVFKRDILANVSRIESEMDQNENTPGIDMCDFTEHEVSRICQSLPNGKAPGANLISYEHLKYAGDECIKVITHIFNAIMKFVYIPECFKHGLLIVLYKGHGKPKDVKSSYRGITLLPTINKIFEKCIVSRLNPFLYAQQFPHPLQHAYRKGSNNIMLSYLVQESVFHHTEKHGKVFACFLDIAQAFDKVWWDGLFYKMYCLGITNKMWFLLKSWFTNSKCSVLNNGKTSQHFNISRSIKQGGILSMINFCIFLHDLHTFVDPQCIYGLKVHDLYVGSPALADDIVLLSTTKHGLDVMISKALEFSRQWRFTFSSSKCKCMVFGETKYEHEKNKSNRSFTMGNNILEEVSHYCHVGITLCAYESSTQRTYDMCNKGNRILASLAVIGVKQNSLHPSVSTFLWNRICIPSVLHGSEIWYDMLQYELDSLEKSQCRALKQIQGLPLRTHNYIVRGLVGQMSMLSLINKKKLMFLEKLISLRANSITKMLFLCRLYDFALYDNMKGFMPEIYSALVKYNLKEFLLTYMYGGQFPQKLPWKSIIHESILNKEKSECTVNLMYKGDAEKFLIVAGCYDSHLYIMYHISKYNSYYLKPLNFLAKLLSLPNIECKCKICDEIYSDLVCHILMCCSKLNSERNYLWDNIINVLSVEDSVELGNMSEMEITLILLGKKWDKLKDRVYRELFYCTVAEQILINFKYSIIVNFPWFR